MQKKSKKDLDLLRSIETANSVMLYSESLKDAIVNENKSISFSAYIISKEHKKEVRCLKYSKSSNKFSINILVNDKVLTEVLQDKYDNILLTFGEETLLKLDLLDTETFSFKKNKKDYDNYIIKFRWKE